MEMKIKEGLVGIGTDIESVKRFSSLPYSENKIFYEKIFTKEEIKSCMAKPNPYQSFAARFASKESIIKAFSRLGVLSFKDVEFIDGQNNIPKAIITKNKFRKLTGELTIKFSMSHTDEYATAVAIITK